MELRTVAEKQELLLRLSRLISRAEAERLRVLAASDDIAVETGDRSTAVWLATQTRDNHGTVRRHAALAAALGSRWGRTAEALGAGDLNLAQARDVVEALEALPDDLGDDLVAKAEAYLVEQAARTTSPTGSAPTWTPTPPHDGCPSVSRPAAGRETAW